MKLKRWQQTLAAAAIVFISAELSAHHDDDNEAFVTNQFASVGSLDITGAGIELPTALVDSPDAINAGTFGVGLGDFDNDGNTDYLVGGIVPASQDFSPPIDPSVAVLIEFHRSTGDGDFAAGVRLANPPAAFNDQSDRDRPRQRRCLRSPG